MPFGSAKKTGRQARKALHACRSRSRSHQWERPAAAHLPGPRETVMARFPGLQVSPGFGPWIDSPCAVLRPRTFDARAALAGAFPHAVRCGPYPLYVWPLACHSRACHSGARHSRAQSGVGSKPWLAVMDLAQSSAVELCDRNALDLRDPHAAYYPAEFAWRCQLSA